MSKAIIKELSGIVKTKHGDFLIDIQDVGDYYILTAYNGFDGKEIFFMECETAIDLKDGIYKIFKGLKVDFVDIIKSCSLFEKIVLFALEELEKEQRRYKALLGNAT